MEKEESILFQEKSTVVPNRKLSNGILFESPSEMSPLPQGEEFVSFTDETGRNDDVLEAKSTKEATQSSELSLPVETEILSKLEEIPSQVKKRRKKKEIAALDEQIVPLLDQNMSIDDIANQLGIDSKLATLTKYRLRPGRSTDTLQSRVIPLLQIKDNTEIVKLLGITSEQLGVCIQSLRRKGMDIPHRSRKQENNTLEDEATPTASSLLQSADVFENIKVHENWGTVQKKPRELTYENLVRLTSNGYSKRDIARILNVPPEYLTDIITQLYQEMDDERVSKTPSRKLFDKLCKKLLRSDKSQQY